MIWSLNTAALAIMRRTILLDGRSFCLAGCSSPEQKAQNYYERGMQFLSQQDYVKAGIEFRNALQLKKDLVGAWRGLLRNRIAQSKRPRCTSRFCKILWSSTQKTWIRNLSLVISCCWVTRWTKLWIWPMPPLRLMGAMQVRSRLRAAVLLKQKDSNGAKREAQAALDADPSNAEALIVLAAERMQAGDTDGALSILDRPGLTYKKEDEFAIQLFRLQIYEKTGDLKQQEVLLHKLVDLYPFETALQKSLIGVYLKEKRYDEAEKELRAYAAAKPSDMTAGLNVVGFLLQFKGAGRGAGRSSSPGSIMRVSRKLNINLHWRISIFDKVRLQIASNCWIH